MQLQGEHVEDLKRSRKLRGERYPIEVDQFGRVINGKHRLAAGWKSKVVTPVKDDLDFLLRRLDSITQRRAAPAEFIELFIMIGNELEKKGMPSEKIGLRIIREISPFDEKTTYPMIADRFKRGYTPKDTGSAKSSEKTLAAEPSSEFTYASRGENDASKVILGPCPRCGKKEFCPRCGYPGPQK